MRDASSSNSTGLGKFRDRRKVQGATKKPHFPKGDGALYLLFLTEI